MWWILHLKLFAYFGYYSSTNVFCENWVCLKFFWTKNSLHGLQNLRGKAINESPAFFSSEVFFFNLSYNAWMRTEKKVPIYLFIHQWHCTDITFTKPISLTDLEHRITDVSRVLLGISLWDTLWHSPPSTPTNQVTYFVLMYSMWVAVIRTLDKGSFTFLLMGLHISYREFYTTELTGFWSELAFCLQMFS